MNDFDFYEDDFTYEEDMDTSYQWATADALEQQRAAEAEHWT